MKPAHLVLLALLALSLFSCTGSSEPETAGPSINIILLTAVDSANPQDTIYAKYFNQSNVSPFAIGLHPKSGHTYHCNLRFARDIDPLSTNTVELTEDLRRMGTKYQVFLTPEARVEPFVRTEVTDRDARGLPLGFEFTLRTSKPEFDNIYDLNLALAHFNSEMEKDGLTRSERSDIDVNIPIRFDY